MKIGFVTAAVVLLGAWVIIALPQLSQSESLWDGTFDGWTIENAGESDFTIADGLLHVEGGRGWLRSEDQYADFTLRSEFRWLTEDAGSGIYVRAVADQEFIRGWPGHSYQVQVRDPSGESRFPPVGGLFRHQTPEGNDELDEAALEEAYRGTGEWHTIEIDAIGEALTIRLNGIEIGRADNIVNAAGYIGIQSELGTIEYRTIEIHER
jgi:hypothetical protein